MFTGATGEEYTLGGQCAVTLDTDWPDEIVTHVLELRNHPERVEAMRKAARARAALFTWDEISKKLLDKIEFVAQESGALPRPDGHVADRRVRDVVIYTIVHQPRRLRLPAHPLPVNASPEALAQFLFDDPFNEKSFRKVAATCYYPAIEHLQSMLERGFKFAIGFSLSFIEQALRWDEELLNRFYRLVSHDNVELVAVEPTHSLTLLWDISRFIQRMRYAADRLEELFGVRPRVADTTELMMSDTVYHALDLAGFQAGFVDGRPWVLNGRVPTHLYHHNGGHMQLLARHYQLSDDVSLRFSDRGWEGWPLMADHYAHRLADNPGELIVLGWDFGTFGARHRAESGIFEFLEALPDEMERAGLSFITPSEAVERYGEDSRNLPLTAFASTWAGGGGLEFFLGNDAQRAVFRRMMQAYQKACLTGDPNLIELALWLAQSDNLPLLQWYGRSDPDAGMSAHSMPQKWRKLGPDGIVWEIQQVYKNFIAALDPYVAGAIAP